MCEVLLNIDSILYCIAVLQGRCLSITIPSSNFAAAEMTVAWIVFCLPLLLSVISQTSSYSQHSNETLVLRHLLVGEKDHQNQKHLISHGEKLAEMYYQHQLEERTRSLSYNSFIHLNPNYPCLHGVIPIGADTQASVIDGHKFSCGILHIKSSPVVYSFGSNRQQDFEQSLLYYRPDSRVYTHDILESHLPLLAVRDPKITYVATALGPSSSSKKNVNFKLIHELMKERGHTYIDVLKIDIEGGEYLWIDNEPIETFTRIGQLMIEVHREDHGTSFIFTYSKCETI